MNNVSRIFSIIILNIFHDLIIPIGLFEEDMVKFITENRRAKLII